MSDIPEKQKNTIRMRRIESPFKNVTVEQIQEFHKIWEQFHVKDDCIPSCPEGHRDE